MTDRETTETIEVLQTKIRVLEHFVLQLLIAGQESRFFTHNHDGDDMDEFFYDVWESTIPEAVDARLESLTQ